MQRFAAGIAVTLLVLAIVVQLFLPAYVGGQAEDRLTERGGRADVSVSALPALTLLAGRGGTFEAQGDGLVFDLDDPVEDPFGRLDGFEQVDVDLDRVEAGPLKLESFSLRRDGRSRDYDMTVRGTTTPGELVRELGSRTGGAVGGLLGGLAGGVLPDGGAAEVDLELNAQIFSDDGRPNVVDASGSVAGIPAGPLAELVAGVVIDRL